MIPAELSERYAKALQQRDDAFERLRQQTARIRAHMAITAPRNRVLIVDDNEPFADAFSRAVHEMTGAEVVVVTRALDALAIARDCEAGDFAAAVVDLHLDHREINGITVAAALPRGVAVYLVTGALPDELAEAAKRVSALGAFQKPISTEQMAALCTGIRQRLPTQIAAH